MVTDVGVEIQVLSAVLRGTGPNDPPRGLGPGASGEH